MMQVKGEVTSEQNIRHRMTITRKDRARKLNQNPVMIWLTGLPCSGKSTIADALEQSLFSSGYSTYLLDGDNLRCGISKDLGFSESDRQENVRRVGEISKLMVDAGLIVIASLVSPYEDARQGVREIVEPVPFFECYVKTSLEVCESRDSKGLYKKARNGLIDDFTGVSSPFEPPRKPNHVIDTEFFTPLEIVSNLRVVLRENRLIE